MSNHRARKQLEVCISVPLDEGADMIVLSQTLNDVKRTVHLTKRDVLFVLGQIVRALEASL